MKKAVQNIEDGLTSAIVEIFIESKAITKAVLKTKISLLENLVVNYKKERFEDRMELFLSDDYTYVTEENKKDFFNSITGKHKEVISSLIEKIYNADYDTHVHLYKFIYQRLQKNKNLNYYDHTLFTNMQQFTSIDFEIFWYQINYNQMTMKMIDIKPLKNLEWKINKKIDTDILSIRKFISLGLVQQPNIKSSSNSDYGITTDININMEIQYFSINEYMLLIYNILDKYISEEVKTTLTKLRKADITSLDEDW